MLFDIDGNGSAGAFSDGVLMLRYMIALRSLALIGGAVALDALRSTAADIEAYLGQVIDRFDIDDNGTVGAFSDGILIARFLTGLRGEALLSGAVAEDANRTTEEEIVAYLEELANSTLGFIDPEEVRTIEENNDLDLELAFERASDLSRYSQEELDATEKWVIATASTQVPDELTSSLDVENLRVVESIPNTFILELSDDSQTTDAVVGQLDSPAIEFAYPLVPIEADLDYTPNDPLFANQWHLSNTGQRGGTAGIDANLTGAWDIRVPGNSSRTVRGRDVVIGIVDDALEFTHPDIANRHRSDLSYDFKDNDRDPSPSSRDEDHGTAVAGVAAASGDNGIGVTGAAPEAYIAGLRLVGGATDEQVADALSWQNQEIDIYQNSWSPTSRLALKPVDPLTLTALQDGARNGRGGKGSIFVFSAGNNREPSFVNPLGADNVNYNGYANSRYTIAVGAIDNTGMHAPYSEPGAPLLISAPGGTSDVGIPTTGLVGTGSIENDYRDDFEGTSAAAPLVAGTIALMLEANPELSWRDVQHILVETAVQNDQLNSDWVINGGGFHVNHLYGFGTIDAEAAVEAAIDWTLVDPEVIIAKELLSSGGLRIPDNNPAGVERTVTINSNIEVEWAEVVFEATHPRRGELEVVLISPDGTESILAEERPDFNADYDNWIFTSARHWGESSVGGWTLRVSDLSSGQTGSINFAELRLYGTEEEVVDANQPPIAVDDVATTEENSSVSIDVLANDSDLDGDEVSFQGIPSSTASGGLVSLNGGTIVYAPVVNFVGTDSFSYTIGDGNGGISSATVTVTVESVNEAPIASDDTATTTEGLPVSIRVLDNDSDPDGVVIELNTFVRTTANGGTIARENNGTPGNLTDDSLVYTPANGFTGTDSFRYTISDAQDTDTATVIVTVLESIGGPTIDPEEVRSIEENNALDLQLAIERASDLSRYTQEELDLTQKWVIAIGSDGLEYAYPLVPIGAVRDYIPNDPLFANQWHLLNTGQTGGTAGIDANITRAWDIRVPGNSSRTVRGRDVVIGIVDGGLEFTHPDIADRYRSDLSNDFLDNDPNPSPNSPLDNHGTAVAGVAAASGDNGIGVTGAAPSAFIAGLRLVGSSMTDEQVADALSWQNQEIDIYQNSWSPTTTLALKAVDPLTLTALQNGSRNGRGGRGSIYVFAAGNNGQPSLLNPLGADNVNYNGYANSRYTIAVGAIDHNGVHAPYSEPGAPVLLSAPSSNSNVGVTTIELVGTGSIENNYRDDFGGTSAAAPLVSGIIALMLEVNPELSWRDVQHILVETAVQNDPSNSDWVINGGGFHVNHLYGFGTVDAEAAVEAAIDWTPVGPEVLIAKEFTGGLAIPDNDAEGVETRVTFNSDLEVDWAEVVFQATHPRRGELEVVLISPDGTESILAEERPDLNADYDNWIFTSVRHWGESSSGEWTLRVSDLSSENTGTLDFAELRLYGTGNADLLTDTSGIGDILTGVGSSTGDNTLISIGNPNQVGLPVFAD